jgi:hypothetical protein
VPAPRALQDVPPILLSPKYYLCNIYRDGIYFLALITGEVRPSRRDWDRYAGNLNVLLTRLLLNNGRCSCDHTHPRVLFLV